MQWGELASLTLPSMNPRLPRGVNTLRITTAPFFTLGKGVLAVEGVKNTPCGIRLELGGIKRDT